MGKLPWKSTEKAWGRGKECGVSLAVRAVSLAVGLFAVPQFANVALGGNGAGGDQEVPP